MRCCERPFGILVISLLNPFSIRCYNIDWKTGAEVVERSGSDLNPGLGTEFPHLPNNPPTHGPGVVWGFGVTFYIHSSILIILTNLLSASTCPTF